MKQVPIPLNESLRLPLVEEAYGYGFILKPMLASRPLQSLLASTYCMFQNPHTSILAPLSTSTSTPNSQVCSRASRPPYNSRGFSISCFLMFLTYESGHIQCTSSFLCPGLFHMPLEIFSLLFLTKKLPPNGRAISAVSFLCPL